MRVKLFGAAGEVTGSAYYVETENGSVMVDFGMFQGSKMAESRNRLPSSLNVGALKAVLLTHAHLDHVGRLPLLAKAGYKNPIYCTEATVDLTRLILEDAAKIQQYDAERWNRKRRKQGLPPVEPIFDQDDVNRVMDLMRPVEYDKHMTVFDGLTARFVEAGHLLGSTSIELCVKESTGSRRVVFSGDLGQHGVPILRDSEPPSAADLLFMESTYGDRNHRPLSDTIIEFETIIKNCVARGGKMLMPTFAVGRAQLITFLLAKMFRENKVPKFPIYLDSPMAVEATKIFSHHVDIMDDELHQMMNHHNIADDLNTLQMVVTPQESMKLNDISGPCLIMAGSGMANAGRILHHLKLNLPNPNTAVIIVGFQADGSLGRTLVEGKAREVQIFGKRVQVNATVHSLGGFSAHADQTGLLQWFTPMADDRPKVVLTHGENKARAVLAEIIQQRYDLVPELPSYEDVIE